MWETFISWYINTYLGHYVQNLNSEQLSFALSQGELELENVPLKKNIFRSWGLPVEVKVGLVGKIKIEFNLLKYFRNEPVVVSIDDIFLVAGPLDLTNWDDLDEAAVAHEAKMAALDSQESLWRASFDLAPSYYSSLYVSSTRIGASIVTKVLENLLLNVRRVHIRFEDENNGRCMAFGLTLDSLSVQTAESDASASFKTLHVGRLGVYCDTSADPLSSLPHPHLKEAMWRHIPSHDFILFPVSAEARITKNLSSTSTRPRFDVSLTLEKVPLNLSDVQYQSLCRQYETLRKLSRNTRLRHYRPYSSITESPREWWIHAVQAVLSLRGFKRRKKLRTWDETLERARNNVLYVEVYGRYLSGELLTSEERKLKDKLEMELHFEDILKLRQVMMERMEQLRSKGEEVIISTPTIPVEPAAGTRPSGLLAWMFPSWGVGYADATTSSPAPSNESVLDEAILDDMRTFGRDALLARCTFHLKQGVVLLQRNKSDFLELDFGGVSVEVCLKPRSGSHTFQVTLCHLKLRDCNTRQSILEPHSVPSASPGEPFLFRLLYEMKPHKRAGHRMTLLTRPMDLILFPATWTNVSSFFAFEGHDEYLEVRYNGYEAMKQKTKDELREYWSRILMARGEPPLASSSWEIHLDIFAPQILVHPHHRSLSHLLIDLGRFQFTNTITETNKTDDDVEIDSDNEEFLTPCSSPVPQDDSPPELSGKPLVDSSDIHAKLYKKYLLEIKDVQVLVVGEKRGRFLHLLDKFSIRIDLERRLVYSEDPLWPALAVVATLPKLTFHLNESKVQVVQAVASAFASPPAPPQSVDLSFFQPAPEEDVETWELVAAEFTIESISVDLQLRGRSIAELQVAGTKATLTRRSPRDTQFSFVIGSLLLADAVQTFGPDFQLLLASHRHVCMDTISGSLKDSEPTSPVSPASPTHSIGHSHPLPSQLHDALLSSLHMPHDALITADLVLTSSSRDDHLAVLTLHFNNLDVIGNQETLMEILQFLGSLLPSSDRSDFSSSMEDSQIVASSSKLQANLEFHRLNVLLLRGVVGHDGNQVARKIATATASDARVNVSLNGRCVNVEGSLGGLQVLNLTPEGSKHQRVLSVGQDPLVDAVYDPFGDPVGSNVTESALSFTYEGPSNPSVSIRMASVIYVHSSLFLLDLKKCVNQFQVPLATSLKSAASHFGLPSLLHSGSLERLDIETPFFPPPPPSRPPLRLDVLLDSPVLVLPRSRDSAHVLVAHLGQTNMKSSDPLTYDLLLCDISLYSLSLESRWHILHSLSLTYPSRSAATLMRAQDLYRCDDTRTATPILHNTVVRLNIVGTEEGRCLEVDGGVVSSLKVSLRPAQYSQVLDTVSNLAVIDDEHEEKWETLNRRFPPAPPLPSPTRSPDESLPIHWSFEVPELMVELVVDESTAPTLSLSSSDLSFTGDRRDSTNIIDIRLKTLLLEDTTAPLDSWRRTLASSLQVISVPSLPNALLDAALLSRDSYQTLPRPTPATPPPSPRPCFPATLHDNLVHIRVTFVDPKAPDFVTTHGGNHKRTKIDFNTLQVLLTPETFASLRKFFSDAALHAVPSMTNANLNSSQDIEERNTETVINVKALTVKLGRSLGLVAEGEVSNVNCELRYRGTHSMGAEGRLGSLQVRDITPFAGNFPLKFAFQGKRALDFDYVRQGSDGKFRLKMSSIAVVHTHRFYTDFFSLWSAIFSPQVDESSLSTSTTTPPEATQVSLDIQAGAPVILLPFSSTSTRLLVAELGHLSVTNKFLQNVNCVSVDLIDMDLYSGILVDQLPSTGFWCLHENFGVTKAPGNSSFLKQKCAMNIKIKRDGLSTRIQGGLSAVHCTIDPEKYKLIRGLLAYNIGEYIEPTVSVPPKHQPRNVVRKRSGEGMTSSVRVELTIEVELVNVTLDVIKEQGRLSRVDFIKSTFTFQSSSDGSKDTDLASQEILITDTRFDVDPPPSNIFTRILQQSIAPRSNSGSGTGTFQSEVPLQAEVHYRQTSRGSNLTIVLNNMRLMLILDWWMEVRAFLSQKIENEDDDATQHTPIVSSRILSSSPLLQRSRELSSPVTVSAGIVTKRAPVLDIPQSSFELKINVSACEMVVVENASQWDTNALILKSTAVLGYRPHLERPVSCSLLQCELFSCILGLEGETALSILDPTNVQLELIREATVEPPGILDATISLAASAKVLRVQSPSVSLRFSYHDMKLFLRILDKFSHEAKVHFTATSNESDVELDEEDNPHLVEQPSSDEGRLGGVEVKINALSLCIIDDCKDCDVPLVELSVHSLELHQSCMDRSGVAECVLSGDYYNRSLSGWEPFLEPWKCLVHWKQNIPGQLVAITSDQDFPSRAPQLEVAISSRSVLDINVTSTLLSLYSTVRANWAEDYLSGKVDNKRRSPFVPFALRNETGSSLWFATILSNTEELLRQEQGGGRRGRGDSTGWIQVAHGAVQPFSFEGRGKLRHRNTHGLRTHQLGIRVDGWEEVVPVSIDRVGTYFRLAHPATPLPRYAGQMELPPTRIVLQVSLQGSAQKVVTVRSALQVKNALEDPLELKLENTIIYPSFERAQTGGSFIQRLQPGQIYPLPLHSVWAQMWVRPLIPIDSYPLYYDYCTRALLLSQEEGVRECLPRAPQQLPPYRFCVAVRRNEFPADSDDIIPPNSLSASRRANLVSLLSPFKLINLLPHEISYEVKGQNVTGQLPAGKIHRLLKVVTTDSFEIIFHVDGFPSGGIISVNPKAISSTPQRVKLTDNLKRPLLLQARVTEERGGVISVALSCPCWIVNKSGLPLVAKQEGASSEAAGQFVEHEVGRMVTPLMMSFTEEEAPEGLTLRVGSGLHKSSTSFWCRSIPCQVGLRVRKLTVAHSNNSPESVYMVGVQLKNGVGRYADTRLVLVSPRFIVDNRSSRKIKISQRCYANSFFDAKAEATHLSLPPSCNLPYHWPRLDKDQLLCVRLSSSWSGGFPIDNVDSFHVNIRESDGTPTFLRVEIVLQGPSYFVIFSDTSQLPPPFRVDNFSLVPLIFHQSCVGEERLKIVAESETSVPYALDEPTQQAHLTIAAPGGTSVVVNMDDLAYVSYLTYENFFYIAFAGAGRNLVLDVPEGSRVVLREKKDGKRSQLWRVNADGLIEHEGSAQPGMVGSLLVLDIAGSAPLPNQFVPLALRKPDKRRASTQHWEFTADGRLKCRVYESVYVQAKDGFTQQQDDNSGANAWHPWNDVVLGPTQPVCHIRTEDGVPVEQSVVRQKLRPGSGALSVTVDTDGPTRVVRVIDVEHPPRKHLHTFEDNDHNTTPTIALLLDLQGGVGVSIVSCSPRRELLYGRFSGFLLEWTETKNSRTVKASVSSLQIDNQLFEAEKSAAMYMSPAGGSRSEDLSSVPPVLHIFWEEMKSSLNARVFKVFEVFVQPLSLIIEERLLLHVASWLGVPSHVESLDALQKSDFEIHSALLSSSSLQTRRYYFGLIKLVLTQVKLTVLTTSKLPLQLKALKRSLGLTLIRFEDANVELDPFEKHHPFETFDFLWALVVKHYRDELVTQAAVILGSTDFLGNPLGFLNDVSEGVSMMIYEGSVGALVKNVAHGLSNSAAKVTGTLGEGLGKTILDERHEEGRRKIKEDHAGSSGEHLYAGLRGFGYGIVGGMTSVISQSYEGIANDGFSGLFTGLTKGIVGTVTKPAVGVLDLATGAASAIRDSSKTSSRLIPSRIRPPRVAMGNGGLLPVYSEGGARGQELLLELNERNYGEVFIGCEILKSNDLRVIISSEAVTVFRAAKGHPVMLKIPLKELVEVGIVVVPNSTTGEKTPYIELVRQLPELHSAFCRPQVICEIEATAKRVVEQVNYAKVLYEEMRHSQIDNGDASDD